MATGGFTIAFDSGHLLERGTDVALYDYAHFNETLLENQSLILCPAEADIPCIDKFRNRFSVLLYRSKTDLAHCLQGVDLYYRIVSGERRVTDRDLVRPRAGRLGIHCVFCASQPHGDIYAAVSSWVARHRSGGIPDIPHVPHIVHLPNDDGDLRGELGIPQDATVLGRHGGFDTFNIGFVQEVVRQVLSRREDLWFLFLNTRPFVEHPRVVYLPATSDMVTKTRFINTTDGMLHARSEGETFGLSVGEFSIRNKPVITWAEGFDNHHVEVLQKKGIYYRSPEQLDRILMVFRPMPGGDWDAFSEEFAPEPVMRKFAEVFLTRNPAPVTVQRGVVQPSGNSPATGIRRPGKTCEMRVSPGMKHRPLS